ncbi:MAG TPA: ATP-binding cassette domain-containing protein [Phototrophicaceae bacterium]|nr:ATP-binding cassette domain-containing protein [Phototrophicaceae bacterium]
MPATAMIQLDRVSKAYNGLLVLNRLSLTVNPGEVVGLVGPSGAGKTTLLHLIAGLIQPDEGHVHVASSRLSYVFQEPRLLPWRSAAANVAAALRANGADRASARMLAQEWLQRVGLAAFAGYYPAQLSGGMQQRVALARAFAVQPDILLLDEPFSHLDDGYKQELLACLRALIQATGVTVVYVTHALPELDGLANHILHLQP